MSILRNGNGSWKICLRQNVTLPDIVRKENPVADMSAENNKTNGNQIEKDRLLQGATACLCIRNGGKWYATDNIVLY